MVNEYSPIRLTSLTFEKYHLSYSIYTKSYSWVILSIVS